MVMCLYDQIRLVVYNIAAGFLIGMLFDIYRLIRGDISSKILASIEDIAFWIIAAFIIFGFMMYTNSALITIYVLLIIIFGIYIYICLISSFFRKMVKILVKFILKLLRIIVNIIVYPIQVMIRRRK